MPGGDVIIPRSVKDEEAKVSLIVAELQFLLRSLFASSLTIVIVLTAKVWGFQDREALPSLLSPAARENYIPSHGMSGLNARVPATLLTIFCSEWH